MFRSARRLWLLVGLLGLVVSGRANAENRVALVIGQSAYTNAPALPNPANDAKLVAQMLEAAGFGVKTALDLTQNEMRALIGDFAARIATKGPDTVAVLYYAGHGLQIDGENFLLPVDISIDRESDVPLQAVRLNDVMNTIAAVPTKMRIVMLDACRNDPFNSINKIAGRGLALVDTKANAAGAFVSFSTSPGTEALDGSGANSPYTSALVESAKQPGLSIEDAFKKVRVAVNKATDGAQTPWESSSLTADFYFFPGQGKGGGARASLRSVAEWKQLLQGQLPQEAYDLVIADDTVEAYQAFVELYPQSPFVTRLRAMIDRRKEMIVWSAAVLSNTASSYLGYLASYPSSDLTPTARKLLDRALNKPESAAGANAAASAANITPVPPVQQASLPGPTCPCAAPEQPKGKQPPPKRADPRGPPRPPPPDDVVVYRRGPPSPPPIYYGGPSIGRYGGGTVVSPPVVTRGNVRGF